MNVQNYRECEMPGADNIAQYNTPQSFTYIPYSAWSKNWRWTSDTTNADPSSWLANENATPSAVGASGTTIRLRYNFAELGGMGQSDVRKKLQYSTDQSSWTDVGADDGASIWRYNNCSTHTDDGTITTTRLTDSSTSGQSHYAWENGTAASSADHNAGKIMETEFCLESNGATASTTYYFRAYDNELTSAVFKQQTASPWAACAGGVLCSYPALTTSSGSGNNAPNDPTSLAQKETDDTTIATGGWIDATSVKFTATATDDDGSDTLYLCIEKDNLTTGFSGTEDSCGSGVGYSGSPVALEHTISSITDATAYHWQARVKDTAGDYSDWVVYGGNSDIPTADRDFGIDTTDPTGGTVYDGSSTGVDLSFNDGSLSSLSANWTGFNFDASGISSYDYSIGTTAGGTNIKEWTGNTTNTSVTATSLTLETSKIYYFNIRANDLAGNSTIVSSNGQLVAPTLSFALSGSSINFANLRAGNGFSDTENSTISTLTNAYNGYVVRGFKTDFLRSAIYPSTYIEDFDGGSYASPSEWTSENYGLGYTSSDTSIQGSAKFPDSGSCLGSGDAPCYAPFISGSPGQIVVDRTTATPLTAEVFTLTYKVQTTSSKPASPYSTNLVYTVSPQY
jgi:hypothetical protein